MFPDVGHEGPQPAAAPPPGPRTRLVGLYSSLAPALHAWAHLRLGAQDRAHLAPEDLTQEIWLRAFQAFDSFDPRRSSFRAWLFTVAKNVLLEARRRMRRTSREAAAGGSSTRLAALDQVPLDITSITRRLAKNDDVRRFVARLQDLDEVEQATVLHCGLEGMTAKEAATRMGESADATAKRWQRLRERLRSWGAGLVDD